MDKDDVGLADTFQESIGVLVPDGSCCSGSNPAVYSRNNLFAGGQSLSYRL